MSAITEWFNNRYRARLASADVKYNADSSLDVYTPSRTTDKPRHVVIFWHGGSWTHGDKSLYRFAASYLADKLDTVIVVPNYQHYPQIKYPSFIDEGWQVVEWVQDNIKKYDADSTNYSVIGHSSGAYTACSIALGKRRPTGIRSPQKCVSLAGPNYIIAKTFWPVFDMKHSDRTKFPAHFARQKLGKIKTVFLVIHGRFDRIVDPRQSDKFIAALHRAGAEAQSIHPFMGHIGLILSIGLPFIRTVPYVRKLIRFLKSNG